MASRIFLADHLCVPAGFLSPGIFEVDARGMITAVRAASASDAQAVPPHAERLRGLVIPGMANLHSHAFQRALAGLTENAEHGQSDSFWTWRTRMYELAMKMTPDDLEAIAAQLYVEMLEAGMTAVGEFHYVHHDAGGQRFNDPAEMSTRILAAARSTGIGLTHLPVLYLHGGFSGAPTSERQRRFTHAGVDEFLKLWERIKSIFAGAPPGESRLRVGIAPHSLRAVGPAELTEVLSAVHARAPQTPVHIHVAEQAKEVAESIDHLGARPVRWLVDELGIDARWCLVHATHVDGGERRALASSGAVAGLCPTTEANLGDGRFPAADYLAERGSLGIGSDSHISVSVTEELRWLEYAQRLFEQRRNLILGPPGGAGARVHVGALLYREACRGGAQALDQPAGALEVGRRADFVVLDTDHPRLVGHPPETMLDAWIFGGADRAVREVWVHGQRAVADGQHHAREKIAARFATTMRKILNAPA